MDRLVDHIFVFEGDGEITDILGNYTAYRSYAKEQALEKSVAAKQLEKSEKAIIAKADVVKKKITFKEKFEFETLGKEIPELESKKAELENRLSTCADHDELMKLTEEIGKIISSLDAKSERWLELGESMGEI
jgi:ATP-binding cassette subfamily F protein uup